MAVGDDAISAGYPIVPNTGEEGRVRYGAREINRTRDLIAQVKALIPVGIIAWQTKAGIFAGTAGPNNNDGRPDGTIYYQLIP